MKPEKRETLGTLSRRSDRTSGNFDPSLAGDLHVKDKSANNHKNNNNNHKKYNNKNNDDNRKNNSKLKNRIVLITIAIEIMVRITNNVSVIRVNMIIIDRAGDLGRSCTMVTIIISNPQRIVLILQYNHNKEASQKKILISISDLG